MGKQRKKHYDRRQSWLTKEDEEDDALPSSAYEPQQQSQPPIPEGHLQDEEEDTYAHQQWDGPSKFVLYQRSVQSPKGDISYMQKFFLTYIGGRLPLHLREDFCGTALISAEWLRSDARRTAVGVDLDVEALTWSLENNIDRIGPDAYSRICLFHGNVLHSLTRARCIKSNLLDSIKHEAFNNSKDGSNSTGQEIEVDLVKNPESRNSEVVQDYQAAGVSSWPAADIVCAFNYSCCCLQRRTDLVLYFKQARNAISNRGGIFVMDLYGGASSELALKLQRRYEDFTYVWQQEEFDIVTRTTKISIHFHLNKRHQILRHAFTYHWRLWTLPEIKDCLEEAGFRSVHFWIREMPDLQESKELDDFEENDNVKYEEVLSFEQQDAWNAYIVGVMK